jgi:hypothetical protein
MVRQALVLAHWNLPQVMGAGLWHIPWSSQLPLTVNVVPRQVAGAQVVLTG